jgi:hypothetical protein
MKKYRLEINGSFIGVIEGKRAFKKWLEDNGKYNSLWTKEDIKLVEVKESHKTEYTIFSNYDSYSEENRKEALENILENMFQPEEDGLMTVTDNFGKEVRITREEYEKTITDEDIDNECNFLERTWFEDEQWELKHVDEHCGLIAIADIGRWNGRASGYKEVKSLESILYSECDYERVYVDSNGDLRKEESHHDGSNSILYRYWKEGLTDEQKENFLNKIYNGECTQKDITRYTRKAGLGIANEFGWTVRGGKNKYRKVA